MGTYLRLLFVSAVLFAIMGLVEKPALDTDHSPLVSTHVASTTIIKGILPASSTAKDNFTTHIRIQPPGFQAGFSSRSGPEDPQRQEVKLCLLRARYMDYQPDILHCNCHPITLSDGKEVPHFS